MSQKVNDIFSAVENEDFEGFKQLLTETPLLINSPNEYGQTPFWLASSFGHTKFIELVLQTPTVKSVLEYNKRDHRGRDALDAAQAFHNNDIIKLLNPIFGVGTYSNKVDKNQLDHPDI